MKLVVGLGNPGDKYKQSLPLRGKNVRHNLGFMVLDQMHPQAKWVIDKKFNTLLLKTAQAIFIKPQTFMNNSGLAVSAVSKYFKIVPQDIILVYDELDLPLGKIRLRSEGGAAGHHGVESVIEALETDQFQRVRLGIGPADSQPDKFVLDQFKPFEQIQVKRMIKEAVSVIDSLLLPDLD